MAELCEEVRVEGRPVAVDGAFVSSYTSDSRTRAHNNGYDIANLSQRHTGTGEDGEAMLMVGSEEFRPVDARVWDVQQRLADMDTSGVDYQILSATPILFQYHRPVDQCVEVARTFNDEALRMCEGSNGRLFSLAQVPLQNVDAACAEASRALRDGHVGVQIGNHVGPIDLDDLGLVAFLQHCALDDIPVLVHPWDMMEKHRLHKYMMGWTVGMPAETQLSICALILGGAFDRLSKSLRICFAHGGGSFAFLLPRLENAWLHRDIARGFSQHPPSSYLNRFTVDSAVFGHVALQLLVDVMSADNVMLGSDYPYPLGEHRAGELIRSSPTLTQLQQEKLLGTNALSFWKLPIPAAQCRSQMEAAAGVQKGN